MTAAAPILTLGDPRLRARARSIADEPPSTLAALRVALKATLAGFREVHGFGRAIAAPQIGRDLRVIALDLGDERGAFTIADPEITWASDETVTLWDDCMSLPGLMVKVRRRRSISLRYVDDAGALQRWEALSPSLSELLQHEIDHLDGILAIDRAEPGASLLPREAYEAARADHDAEVDLTIIPTVRPPTAAADPIDDATRR